MGDLTLRINASFDKAQQAFEELADSSEETRKQMERFAERLKDNHVDEFNRKQKMLQNALTGTRGETIALEQSTKNYQREIERLIRGGLSPNSDAVARQALTHLFPRKGRYRPSLRLRGARRRH